MALGLARAAYSGVQSSDPTELLNGDAFGTAEAIEDHLVRSYLPAVYPDRPMDQRRHSYLPWQQKDAQRWLGYLAAHLNRLGTRDLGWWQLSGMIPRIARAAMAGLPVGVLALLSGMLIASPTTEKGFTDEHVVALATALGLAVATGIVFGGTPPEPAQVRFTLRGRLRPVLGQLRLALRTVALAARPLILVVALAHGGAFLGGGLLGQEIGTSFGIGAALVVTILMARMDKFFSGASGRVTLGTGVLVGIAVSAVTFTVFGSTAALATGSVTGLLVALTTGVLSTSLDGAARRQTFGTMFGVVFGVVVFVVAADFYTGVGDIQKHLSFGIIFGAGVGLLMAGLFGLVFGVLGGLATAMDIKVAVSPFRMLGIDRRNTLVQTITGGLLVGLAGDRLFALVKFPLLGLAIGAVVGAIGGFSASAWGHWLIFPRLWLPATGRLPWRAQVFLEDAHRRGVLRQVGAVYQFRHARIHDHIAELHGNRHTRRPLPRHG